MRLEKIHVVQFFLYEAQTIEPGRMSAFFGPNGSGKSALIDAVQIALFGGNANLVALNAKADDGKGKKRTIRAYCLGQYGELPEQRARTQARTYITLVWRDPASDRPVSTGVCIEAGDDDPTHNVRGAYVADGVELRLGDHLTPAEDGDETSRNWHAFRDELKRRTAAASDYQDDVVYESSERYLRAALTRLSNGKDSSSIALFRRALRFGLRLRFDRPVDETLRHEVLEERPTNIEGFRAVMEQFRRLREQVDAIQKKLDAAKRVEDKYRAAERAHRHAESWRLIELDIENDASQSTLQDAYRSLERVEDAREAAHAGHRECEKALKAIEAECDALRLRQTRHAAHGQYATLTEALAQQRKSGEEAVARRKALLRDLRATLSSAANLPELAEEAVELTACADRVVTEPCSHDTLKDAVAQAVRGASKALNTLRPRVAQLGRDIETLEGEISSVSDDLERAKAGHARLPGSVRKLREHLANHGIDARPVCEGASVRDQRWQPAIEGLLGRSVLSALIVAAHDEKQAFDLYRRAPADCSGRLVYSSWVDTAVRAAPGTVGALIEGDDAVAVAYLRTSRRGVDCVDSFEEVSRSRNALTVDGMFASGATIERRKLPQAHELLLGAATGGASEALATRLRMLREQLSRLERRQRPLEEVSRMLARMPSFEQLWNSIDNAANEQARAEKLAMATEHTLRGQAESDYVEIVAKLGHAEQALRDTRAAESDARSALAQSEATCKAALLDVERSEKLAGEAQERSRAAYDEALYDEEYLAQRWDGLISEHASNYARMREVCADQLARRRDEQRSTGNAANSAATEFAYAFSEHAGGVLDGGWRTALPWVRDIVRRLEETDLPRYRDELVEAEVAAQETFRTDVALTLYENVRALGVHQRKLNEALQRCPTFSNGERYHFTRTLRPQYKELYEFVERIAQHGPSGDMFGAPGKIPDEFRQLLEEKTALGAGNGRTPLDDYREFFEFDVEIRREDVEGTSWKKVGTLSKRIGPGSGGEHSAPLYVLAGAALASAYNLNAQSDSGMHLILIDEAFDRMDSRNIAATMRFFEQLGLQVFLACPIDKRPVLTAFLDRYYTIARDPDMNVIYAEPSAVSEEARLIARADMPEFHPELLEAEIAAVRTQRLARTS